MILTDDTTGEKSANIAEVGLWVLRAPARGEFIHTPAIRVALTS